MCLCARALVVALAVVPVRIGRAEAGESRLTPLSSARGLSDPHGISRARLATAGRRLKPE
jgi:hypothetical protein